MGGARVVLHPEGGGAGEGQASAEARPSRQHGVGRGAVTQHEPDRSELALGRGPTLPVAELDLHFEGLARPDRRGRGDQELRNRPGNDPRLDRNASVLCGQRQHGGSVASGAPVPADLAGRVGLGGPGPVARAAHRNGEELCGTASLAKEAYPDLHGLVGVEECCALRKHHRLRHRVRSRRGGIGAATACEERGEDGCHDQGAACKGVERGDAQGIRG